MKRVFIIALAVISEHSLYTFYLSDPSFYTDASGGVTPILRDTFPSNDIHLKTSCEALFEKILVELKGVL